jgi:hypothetical protein
MCCTLALFGCDLRARGATGGDHFACLTAAVTVARVGAHEDGFPVNLVFACAADRL